MRRAYGGNGSAWGDADSRDVRVRLMTRRRREMDSNPRSPVSGDHPSATANHLFSHHLPRKLGLRFAPKASTPSRKSSELRRRP